MRAITLNEQNLLCGDVQREDLLVADVANVSASSGGPGRRDGDMDRPVPTDEALVRRLAEGEAPAVGPLYDRYRRLAYSLALRMCADRDRAEEVVLETFIALWRDPWLFDPRRGDLGRWLVTEVHRRAVEVLRGRDAEHRQAGTARYLRDDWPSRPAASSGETESGGMVAGKIQVVLARLPETQGRTFLLAYYAGYTQPEIAALTGLSPLSVLSSLFSATRRLRRLLLPPREAAPDLDEQGR